MQNNCALCGNVIKQYNDRCVVGAAGGYTDVCARCVRVIKDRASNMVGGDPLLPNFAVWR